MGVSDSILYTEPLGRQYQTMFTHEKDVLKTRCPLAMSGLLEYRNSRSPRLGVMLRICDIKTYSKAHFRKSSINHSISLSMGRSLSLKCTPKPPTAARSQKLWLNTLFLSVLGTRRVSRICAARWTRSEYCNSKCPFQ